MSIWDETGREREAMLLRNRGAADGSLSYTYFLSTDWQPVARLLVSAERDIFRLSDFHDFARLVEDFVLCDNVGLATCFSEYLGPYLIDHFPDMSEYPLFDLEAQINAVQKFENEKPQPASSSQTDVEGPPAALRSIVGSEDELRRDVYQKKEAELWLRVESLAEELSGIRWGTPQYLEGVKLFVSAGKRCLAQRRLVQHQIKRLLRQNIFRKGLSGTPLTPDENRSFGRTLSRWSRHYGVSVSPGYSIRGYMRKADSGASLARRLYDEADSVHRELLSVIAKWSRPELIHVPPVLSIVLARAKTRDDIIPSLVKLRQEFSDLRRSMRQASAELSSDVSLKEKLKIARSLETARETILKDAAPTSIKSVVQRTWSIVKKRSAWGALSGLADIALEWDAHRQLIGGVRHFVHMERRALNARVNPRDIERLFGELRVT